MKPIETDPNLVAYCGIYCGSCKAYRMGKCPSCAKNEKAAWCCIRKCCLANNYKTCAECQKYADVMNCKDFNNFFSKLFGFIFRSNRKACIDRIKEIGIDAFAKEMAEKGEHSIKR